MGKRKHREEDEEDYLERKIRSLERKRLKIRRRRRHRSYSPSTSSYTDNEYEYADQDIGEPDPLLEDSQYEESPLTNNTVYDLTDDEAGASTSGALPAAGGLRSVVIQNGSAAGPRAVDAPAPAPPPAPAAAAAAAPACAPAAATTTPAAPAPAPTSAATTTQVTGEQIGLQESTPIVTALDPGLLCLLGDEPVKEETFGPCIHDDISTR
ncbi:angiomotin-like [Leguminivora glycinivorella]|uniref:angiomotin-like n=1 Tax=Leguminivora glycinivorella TaxID=1035111 RepID=UPI00200C427A|nr:angiomotin-like [Leguminivora glycinivorella]